ncbi:MAG: amidase [Nocardioides sp.]|jgi:aspartyl-tRNA(Asn)/glutamyl-tRNA(Gln) amidotransferase subunit A|uniref:amidase family protein n=1 Tax=Nocardioides sp. TaxID=35761 RepID=UPI00262AA79C|nr:amidase [Nocardioides sp.]MCW2833952.1 amidase [Nocardioides sp.]
MTTAPPRRTSSDRYDPSLASFISFEPEPPRSLVRGDLAGLTVGVKDNMHVAGFHTTNGALRGVDEIARSDAPAIADLRARGATVFGKTNLNEYAYGVSGYNPHFGAVLNPLDRLRTAGGSSGGSAAAVAAGVIDIGIGTDTSGSTRIPAACCNVYGFKLAHGHGSMLGVTPLAPSFDSLGYFAADVADLQRVMGLPVLPDPDRLTIGRLGDNFLPPTLPHAHWTVFRDEVWRVHAKAIESDAQQFGKDLQWKFTLPRTGADDARHELLDWRATFIETARHFDVFIGPVFDGPAPTVAEAEADYERDEFVVGDRLLKYTPVYNELGWPALTCPTREGPIQIAARPGHEAAILAVAKVHGLERDETVVG